ncbi:hypothetical protein HII36_15575 [Nonomuraea sp. NN258]|uniref:hypothetical protein n=1 Tax=Nonomuraea antri TaxID=2730852 RepID=UPI0015694343|nr:hypothetical protein [Nonomuraea antri]NRQ33255.1 hypothetical protein [Nonomuraea antri]
MESVENRIAELEKQVAFLHRYLGLDPALVDRSMRTNLPPQFFVALRAGKMVRAIKIYREVTGASLKTAKHAVETIARQERPELDA